jgi:hypothetical protein
MTFLKAKTNTIFVPTLIANSPLNPNTEMIIVMRPSDLVDKHFFDGEVSFDESLVAKRFTVRVFQFLTKDPTTRLDQLKTDLMNLYRTEGLLLVGGI